MWKLSDLTHRKKPNFASKREGLEALPSSGLGSGWIEDSFIDAGCTDNGF